MGLNPRPQIYTDEHGGLGAITAMARRLSCITYHLIITRPGSFNSVCQHFLHRPTRDRPGASDYWLGQRPARGNVCMV